MTQEGHDPLPKTFYPMLPEAERRALAGQARTFQAIIDSTLAAQGKVLVKARQAPTHAGAEAIIRQAMEEHRFPILPDGFGLSVRPCAECGLPFNDQYHPPPTRLCRVRMVS